MSLIRASAAYLVLAAWCAVGSADAQDTMQLNVPAPEYTLGGWVYKAPSDDGWRQIANIKESLSLVYAEQVTPESIETRIGLAMEVHPIPEGTAVESAAALADLSRQQMAEGRGTELVALSGIEAVPSIENMYTYRLLVHAPVPDMPDAYEVYYVALAPTKTEYLVIQVITKTQDYSNQLYFQQFYGSLASLKYLGRDKASSESKSDSAKLAGPESAKPADDASSKPATGAEAPHDHDHDHDHAGH